MQGEKAVSPSFAEEGAGDLGTIRGICQGIVDRCVEGIQDQVYVLSYYSSSAFVCVYVAGRSSNSWAGLRAGGQKKLAAGDAHTRADTSRVAYVQLSSCCAGVVLCCAALCYANDQSGRSALECTESKVPLAGVWLGQARHVACLCGPA